MGHSKTSVAPEREKMGGRPHGTSGHLGRKKALASKILK